MVVALFSKGVYKVWVGYAEHSCQQLAMRRFGYARGVEMLTVCIAGQQRGQVGGQQVPQVDSIFSEKEAPV